MVKELATYCEEYWWNMGQKTLFYKGTLGELLKVHRISFNKKITDDDNIFMFNFTNPYGVSFSTTGRVTDFTLIAKLFIQMELVRMGDKAQLFVTAAYKPTVSVNFPTK